jgi:hypothetical protein
MGSCSHCAGGALVLAVLILSRDLAGGAQPQDEVASCGKRLGDAVRSHTERYFGALAACPYKNLSRSTQVDCSTDGQTLHALESAVEKLASAIEKCSEEGLSLLCPLETTTPEATFASLVSEPDSLQVALIELEQDLFETAFAGCSRPPGVVSQSAVECAKVLQSGIPRAAAQLGQCISKCEVALTKAGGEACVDADTGEPIKLKVVDCVAKARERLSDLIAIRCRAPVLAELGCPVGATDPAALEVALTPRLDELTTGINRRVFHASCRTIIPISTVPTTALVRLTPSGTERTINCGDVLDATFFGSDTGLVLTSDLDCQASATATNGIVVAASGVHIDLGDDPNVSGPANSSLRTGTGILVAAGAHDVTIERADRIERFGVGVADSGDNAGLFLRQLVIQGNRWDGIRITGSGITVDSGSIKKNGGNGITLSGSGNTITSSTFEENQAAGIVVSGTNNFLEGNQAGTLDDHGNATHGFLILTAGNRLESNSAEANLLAGFEINAPTALFEGNDAEGNFGSGFEFKTGGTVIDSSRGDENGGPEFMVAAGNIDGGGNHKNGSSFQFGPAGGTFE